MQTKAQILLERKQKQELDRIMRNIHATMNRYGITLEDLRRWKMNQPKELSATELVNSSRVKGNTTAVRPNVPTTRKPKSE